MTRISFATVAIEVLDADDQGPAFVYPDCPKVDQFCANPAYNSHITENATVKWNSWKDGLFSKYLIIFYILNQVKI